MKTAFEVGILVFVLGFILAFSFFFTQKVFFEQSVEYTSTGISAFMGAFFAFLFLRLGDGFSKMYERQIKHYNALVELDFVLNKNRQEIATNLFVIKQIEENLNESVNQNLVIENPQGLRKVSTRFDLLLQLYGKETINKVFAYFGGVDTLNDDLSTTERLYRRVIEQSLVKENPLFYLNSVPELKKHFSVLEKFLNDLMSKTNDVLAVIRIGLKRKPLLTKLMFFAMRGYASIKENDVEKERRKIETEVEEVRKKSKEDIERILNS